MAANTLKPLRKKKEPTKRGPRKTREPAPPVDVSQALDLRLNHRLTYAEIAKVQGVTPQNVHKKIKHLIPSALTQDYIANRGDILANAQLRLLASGLTDAKLKKVSPRDAVVSVGILYDKERLERGQATEITDIRGIMLQLDAAEARALKLIPDEEAPQPIDITS